MAVNYIHTGVFKPGWEKGRNEEEGKWTREEWRTGEAAERESLGLPPLTKKDEDEDEEDKASISK